MLIKGTGKYPPLQKDNTLYIKQLHTKTSLFKKIILHNQKKNCIFVRFLQKKNKFRMASLVTRYSLLIV